MAKQRKTNTRKTKTSSQKKAAGKKRKTPKRVVNTGSQILDLTGTPDRPTVKLDKGDFKMRLPEELTFAEFGRQAAIGATLVTMSERADEDGVLEELQALVMEAAKGLLIDLTDDAALSLTPGMYLKISDFFNGLVDTSAVTTS